VDLDEFREGIKALGVPATKPQIAKMFAEWDADGGGTLTIDEMASVVLGTTQPLEESPAAPSSRGARTVPPTASSARHRHRMTARPQSAVSHPKPTKSHGGAPRMPREFLPPRDHERRREPSQEKGLAATLSFKAAPRASSRSSTKQPQRPSSASMETELRMKPTPTVWVDPRSYISAHVDLTKAKTKAPSPQNIHSRSRKPQSLVKTLVQSSPSATLIPGLEKRATHRSNAEKGHKAVASWYPTRDVCSQQEAQARADEDLHQRLKEALPGGDGGIQAIYSDVTLLRPNNYESMLNLP